MVCIHDRKRVVDPTGTGAISNAWRTDVRVRVREIEKRAKNLLTVTEGIGVSPVHFRLLVEKSLLRPVDWWEPHITKAYKHGLARAAKKLGQTPPATLAQTHKNVIDMIVGRTGRAFEAIASELSGQLTMRTQEAVDMQQAIAAARSRIKAIGEYRANLVVSVETIATHAEATLNHFRAAGVQRVGLEAEGLPPAVRHDQMFDAPRRGARGRFASAEAILATWETAGDLDVCPECAAMEGKTFDLDEAEGMIPLHPNCRCDWLPAPDNPYATEEELLGQGIPVEELL